jgi:competence protein ComEA
MVAAITVALSGFALVPPSPPDVPERIVNVPGLGWVDAEATPGVPASARDGEVLILAAVRSTFADPDILDASGATPSPAAVAEVAAAEASPDRPDGAAFGAPVSINGGSLAQLDSLPGIGPALAKRIVAARPFRSIGELDRVKGIGPKTVAKLRPFVAL